MRNPPTRETRAKVGFAQPSVDNLPPIKDR